MSQWEINAKKIETLTKVARLLGDQIQVQNRAINQLQNEVDWIKETLKRKKQGINAVPIVQQAEIAPTKADSTSQEIDSSTTSEKKLSDKEELLQALRIIDEL
jgi:hypothetical protein